MDGIRVNDVTLFLGKVPGRKQECFYFAQDNILCPVAYVSEKNLPEAKRLWGRMLDSNSLQGKPKGGLR